MVCTGILWHNIAKFYSIYHIQSEQVHVEVYQKNKAKVTIEK